MAEEVNAQRLCRRRKGEKHTLTVKEALEQRKKRKIEKKSKQKRVQLEGFTLVDKGDFVWKGSGELGGIAGLPRRPTKADIFSALTPDVVLEKIIQKGIEVKKKGAHSITLQELRQYWAVRIYLQGVSIKDFRDAWPLPSEVFGDNSMSRDKFFRIHRLWITPAAVKELNIAAEQLVLLPEVINIDEKLKAYDGNSPYKRYVPNKDPPCGHWITEATIKGKYTGLPFLLNSCPIQQKSGPTMLELYQASLERIPQAERKRIVVVTDAYYMDDRSRTWLREAGFMYLAAINPTRFKEVWDPLILKVKKIGQWSVAWNAETKEAAYHYWDPEHGRQYLLTNAFRYQTTNKPMKEPAFHDVYGLLFNTSDRLNHYIAKRGWPYRRRGWMYSFDDFHFTTLVWNTYMLYHECYALQRNLPWEQFCVALGKELWTRSCL